MAPPLTYEPISVRSPADLADATFFAIEALMLLGFALAVTHAVRHRRRTGSPSALLTLGGCFLYGLVVDITAYYTVDSFRHGEFSVMFLDHRLPLYIALFYPAFLYPAFMTIRRFGFSARVEAVSVGFYSGVTYLIFDNLGPLLGWWTWDRSDPLNQPFLDSVPLTSYQWFFFFTTAFALVARRICWERAPGRSAGRTWAELLAIPVLTYLVGALMFIPFNVFVAFELFTVDAFSYAVIFTAAGLAFLLSLRRVRLPRDPLLMAFPLLWVVGLLYLYIATFERTFGTTTAGLNPQGRPVGNLMAVGIAMVASVAMTLLAHPLRDGQSQLALPERPSEPRVEVGDGQRR